MLEYEKKIMLRSEEYLAIILMMCKNAHVEIQTNYYFDTDDLSMDSKGITCRIREKDGKYRATIKNHKTEHPDCNMEENLSEKTKFDPQIFNAFGLKQQGKMVTQRIVVDNNSFYKMVLDRNTYLGHTDFELEIEYRKETEYEVNTLLEWLAKELVLVRALADENEFLGRIGQGKSKSQRFFEKKS